MDLSMRAGSLEACENMGRFQKDASRAAGFVAATTNSICELFQTVQHEPVFA